MTHKLLFIDTESDIKTKEIISIQTGFDNVFLSHNPKNPNTYQRIFELWNNADAVIMYNAPYDLGVLSSYQKNKFDYKDGWILTLFNNKYKVRRINGFRNLIKPITKHAPPVIDLLKLWSILIEEKDISLKSLIKRELHETPIPYTPENALKLDYQIQDVKQLSKLWSVFLEKVKTIPPVSDYNYEDYSRVSTPATFSKRSYKHEYPELKAWQQYNISQDKQYGLSGALETAYNGGITFSLYHGTLKNTAWYDIHGAYAHVIEYLNTDRFKKYQWSITNEFSETEPLLCRVNTNAVITSINHSLKMFSLKNKHVTYMWNFDILALRNIFDNADIEILQMFKPIPLLNIARSLSAVWSDLKDEEERKNGKTTLREYYKFMSNTSYGITAQRNPYKTIHTNMCIAGMITSRAHLILSQMIKTARDYGYIWRYSDTDSICVSGNGSISFQELETRINENIYPYSVGCEFIGTTKIMSLKRYHAYNGIDINGKPIADKIRLHGKSIYKISEQNIVNLLNGKDEEKPLIVSQVSANTAITYNRVLHLNHNITNPHPFMFETNQDTGLCLGDWFYKWIRHIDRKATNPENAHIEDEYTRELLEFENITYARLYYGVDEEDKDDLNDIAGLAVRDYDKEDSLIWNYDG